jgi:hypothetical protein
MRLVEELVDQIISNIPPSSLPSLLTLSKSFNRILTPHLYSTIRLGATCERPDASKNEWSLGKADTLYLRYLTYHLLKNRELACMVRYFDNSISNCKELEKLGRCRHSLDPERMRKMYFWPADEDAVQEVLREAVKRQGFEDEYAQTLVCDALLSGRRAESAIFLILIRSLPNLQNLYYTSGGYCADYTDALLWNISGIDSSLSSKAVIPFQRLKNVMHTGAFANEYPTPPSFFGACLALPALRNLYGYRLGYGETEDNSESYITETIQELSPKSSTVETIELRCSKLLKDDLFSLLEAPKELKTFIYEIGHEAAGTGIVFCDIGVALGPQQDYLRELCLSWEACRGLEEPGPGDDFSPVSLGHLTALKVLKIAPVFLFGHHALTNAPLPGEMELEASIQQKFCNRLPRNIEYLHLTLCEYIFVGGNGSSGMVDEEIVTVEGDDEYIDENGDEYEDEEDGEGDNYFYTDKEHLISSLEELINRKKTYVPHLTHLTFQGQFVNDELSSGGSQNIRSLPRDATPRVMEVAKLAKDMGIEPVVINDRYNADLGSSTPQLLEDQEKEERNWGIHEDVRWAELHGMQSNQRIRPKKLL